MMMYPASLFKSKKEVGREEEASVDSEATSVAEVNSVAAETQTEPREPSENNYEQVPPNDFYYGDDYNELSELSRLIREQQHEFDTFKFEHQQLKRENDRLRAEVRELSEKEKNKLLGGGYTNLPLPKFNYPPTHDLTNIQHRKLADYTFGKVRFTNGESDYEIFEFLSHLTKCQNKLNLSETDFQDIMLERLGTPALGLVSGWIDQKISMRNIYSQLHATFNSTISASQAMEVLRNYTFPRGFNLAMVLSELQAIANYALRGGGESIENSILLTINVQEGLKRSMPEKAYTIIFTSLSELRHVWGRAPHLPEILGNLQRIHEQVDYEIGKAYNFRFGENRRLFDICSRNYIIKYLQKHNESKHNRFYQPKIREIELTPKEAQQKLINYDINKVDKRNTFPPPNRRFPMSSPNTKNNTYNAQNGMKPKHFNNNNYNKQKVDRSKQPLCSMCGSYTHSAHEVCYSLMDDMGKIYEGPPAGVGCNICEKELNKDFRHLASHCPIRAHMMKMYKIGKYKPRGIFKVHYEKKLREGKI